jgi:predicted nucleic acid-binding protein
LIAATCKVYGATLVTSDLKDYPMEDIKIVTKI